MRLASQTTSIPSPDSSPFVRRLRQPARLHHALHQRAACVGALHVWEAAGYRVETSPFGGIQDSGDGYKGGVWEAMKSFTNDRTCSLPGNA